MEEALVKREQPIMTDEEAAEVTQVSKGALDFPAFGVTTQSAAIVASRADVSCDEGRARQCHAGANASAADHYHKRDRQ